MPLIRERVDTTLDPAAVFDYVANFETAEEWDPGVVSSQKLTDGPLDVGSQYAVTVQYGGAPQPMTYTVTEVTRPSLVVIEGEGARSITIDRISFSEEGGGTVIDYEADIRMRGIYRAAQPFLGKLFTQIGEGARAGLNSRLAELADSAAE